jgi:hypothetical protein
MGHPAPEETELANQIAGLLSGCYAEQRREISAIGQGRLVSLYFLTPKTDVEPFWELSPENPPCR